MWRIVLPGSAIFNSLYVPSNCNRCCDQQNYTRHCYRRNQHSRRTFVKKKMNHQQFICSCNIVPFFSSLFTSFETSSSRFLAFNTPLSSESFFLVSIDPKFEFSGAAAAAKRNYFKIKNEMKFLLVNQFCSKQVAWKLRLFILKSYILVTSKFSSSCKSKFFIKFLETEVVA